MPNTYLSSDGNPLYFRHYDYRSAVAADVKAYIRNHIALADFDSREDLAEYLLEELDVEESVTGLGDGGCHADPELMQYWVIDNLDLLHAAIRYRDISLADVIDAFSCSLYHELDYEIRSYVLADAIDDALDAAYGAADGSQA